MTIDEQRAEFLYRELAHHRDKQWKLFSWYSTIMTAIIGGIGVLSHELPTASAAPLSFAIVTLCTYVCSQFHYHRQTQDKFEKEVTKMTGLEEKKARRHRLWYPVMAILLGFAALATTWLGRIVGG